MEKEGRLIEPVDPKPAIKKHQETAEWVYRDESKFWNQVAEKMEERFFNGLLYPDGRHVPPPVMRIIGCVVLYIQVIYGWERRQHQDYHLLIRFPKEYLLAHERTIMCP
jgi:hypothetical protein